MKSHPFLLLTPLLCVSPLAYAAALAAGFRIEEGEEEVCPATTFFRV